LRSIQFDPTKGMANTYIIIKVILHVMVVTVCSIHHCYSATNT